MPQGSITAYIACRTAARCSGSIATLSRVVTGTGCQRRVAPGGLQSERGRSKTASLARIFHTPSVCTAYPGYRKPRPVATSSINIPGRLTHPVATDCPIRKLRFNCWVHRGAAFWLTASVHPQDSSRALGLGTGASRRRTERQPTGHRARSIRPDPPAHRPRRQRCHRSTARWR